MIHTPTTAAPAERARRISEAVVAARDLQRADGSVGSRRALTLVELLIVMAIISVMTAIALPVTRGLIEEGRISSSVRTIRAYMEHARASAMQTGREYGVTFHREGTDSPASYGTVTSLSLVSGAPSYRGDVEGATCWLFHETTYTTTAYGEKDTFGPGGSSSVPPPAAALVSSPNVAAFDPVQCPSLFRTVQVLEDNFENGGQGIPPLQPGDLLTFNGQRFPIVAFGTCDTNDPPFTIGGIPPSMAPMWIKVYFDPRSATDVSGLTLTMPQPPQFGAPTESSFEILRTRLRGSGSNLELARGAAVDLFLSGFGTAGTEFSPLSDITTTGPVLKSVVVVFAPSGMVSRVVLVEESGGVVSQLNASPTASIYFLVGRTDQVRPDLLSPPVSLAATDDDEELSNIMDPRSAWVSINPLNGRITTSDIGGPSGPSSSLTARLAEARRPAVDVRESNQ